MLRRFALLGALVFASTTFAAGNKIGAVLGFDNVAKITLGADYEHEVEKNFVFRLSIFHQPVLHWMIQQLWAQPLL